MGVSVIGSNGGGGMNREDMDCTLLVVTRTMTRFVERPHSLVPKKRPPNAELFAEQNHTFKMTYTRRINGTIV